MFTFQVGVQLQAVFAYGGKVFATGNAGDVFAGKCEEGGDASTYAASTGDKVFQGWVVITVVCMVNVIERNFLYLMVLPRFS